MVGSIDLHNALSFRPIPLQHITLPDGRHSRSQSHASHPPHNASPTYEQSSDGQATKDGPSKSGASTGIEATTPPEQEHDPIRRNINFSQVDLEDQRLPQYTTDNDPYHLSAKLKTSSEINSIRTGISRRPSIIGPIPITTNKNALRAHKVRNFYEDQNENIERLLKPVDEHRRQAKETQDSNALQYKIAVNGSFIANICLAGLQLYGAIASGSLSLFTTMADALFDPLSNVTLILSARAVNRVDPRKFPSGKARIETAGNIVFCFLMCSVSFIIIVLSARDLASGSLTLTAPFYLPSTIAVSIAIVTKFCLFLYCFALRNTYSQIRILWEDHRNDLIINSLGLCTSILGSKVRWWIDPAGAILLSLLIVVLWLRTAYKEFQLLIGVTADPSMLQLITYISATHDTENILALDTVRAWHSGPRLIVEVDIVMREGDSLRSTHDTAEELQCKLESLPDVERAYVHVDFETSHAPEHFFKKVL